MLAKEGPGTLAKKASEVLGRPGISSNAARRTRAAAGVHTRAHKELSVELIPLAEVMA